MKYLKKVFICTAVICVFIIPDTCAYSVNNNVTPMENFQLKQSNNGGFVNLQKKDDYTYILDFNTDNLNSGYYTAYLYNNNNTESDWSKYVGICFYIKNESETDANININVKTKDNKVLTIKDEDSILIQKSGDSYFERIHPLYGTVQIQRGFEGTVYILFNILKDSKNNGYSYEDISAIESWGIIVTSKEDDKKRIVFGNFNFINSNNDFKNDFNSQYSIKGDAEVQIPTAGQSISEYKLIDNNTKENILNSGAKVEYYIDGEEEGVSINNDGILTVTKDAEEKKIKAYAVINNEVKEDFEVQLFKSWTLNAKEIDGTYKSIPDENEINNSSALKIQLFDNVKVIRVIRVFCVLIGTSIVILYSIWQKQRKEKLK